MEEDWQNEMWEYAQDAGIDDDPYEDEPKERGEDGDGEDEYEERGFGGEEEGEIGGGGEEEMEFVQEYKQLQQTSHERRSNLGTAGAGDGVQKAQRTPEEATLDQVEGVISSTYSDISDALRQKIVSRIEKIKGVYLYNVDVLVLATIWMVEGRELSKKTLGEFLAKYKNKSEVDLVDLIRYIRTFQAKK